MNRWKRTNETLKFLGIKLTFFQLCRLLLTSPRKFGKRYNMTMARGTSKSGLAYTMFMHDLTGEWVAPPWVNCEEEDIDHE